MNEITPARLRLIRVAAGLHQHELAAAIAVDRSTVTKYERRMRGLSPDTKQRIYNVLHWDDPSLQNVITAAESWKEGWQFEGF